MSAHTKGPWKVGRSSDGNVAVHADGHLVARLFGVFDLEHPNTVVDAHLIAAAPDLLEVCQRFMEFVKNGERFSYPSGSLQQLEAAIAKATGAPQ